MPDDTTATIGRDELGPVMEWYLHRLDHHLQIAADRDALVLFVARAGVRLHELYHGYLAARDRIASADNTVLWASRFLFCKAFATQAPSVVNEHIRSNCRTGTIADLITGLTRHEPDVEASLEVTNGGDDTADYSVTVGFYDGEGVRRGTGSAYVEVVRPGESAPSDVFTVVEDGGDYTCEVIAVDRSTS